MKNKKIIMYVSIILIVTILTGVGYYIFNKSKNKNIINEYIPEEEISENQLRQTVITLYFLNPINHQLQAETRKIDSKLLIESPYELLINFLIEGPENSDLKKLIPDGTKILNTEIKDDILYIDFSNDFIRNQNLGVETEELILKSIVNTLTELTEINKIKILIDGKEGDAFPDNGVTFDKVFIKYKSS